LDAPTDDRKASGVAGGRLFLSAMSDRRGRSPIHASRCSPPARKPVQHSVKNAPRRLDKMHKWHYIGPMVKSALPMPGGNIRSIEAISID
jgi:hypothetical protein